MGLAEDLTSLADLFERTLLSKEQFAEAKARLLDDDGEIPPEASAADPDQDLLPPSSPPDDAEAPGGVSPQPLLSDFENTESAGEDEPEGLQGEESEEVGEAAPQTLWEQVKKNARVLSFGALTIVVSIVGLSVYGEFFAPRTEAEPRRELEANEGNLDAAGHPYPTGHQHERMFIDVAREQMPGHGHVMGNEMLEWGYETCNYLAYHQVGSVIDFATLNLNLFGRGVFFADEEHLYNHVTVSSIASWTLCAEHSYLQDIQENRDLHEELREIGY